MTVTDIPKKQKAVVYDQPGTVSTKVEEIDVPEPGTGEVLINLYVSCSYHSSVFFYSKVVSFPCTDKDNRTHSGVCHSDYGVMTNSVSHIDLRLKLSPDVS